MTEALFHREGDRFTPSELTRGPWDPEAQHGGPPAALLAHLVEELEGLVPMSVARLTVEFLRPVPLRPLTGAVRLLRPGRNLELVEASLSADGTEVARASALRIRQKELGLGDLGPSHHPGRPTPEETPPAPPFGMDVGTAFHANAVEVRSEQPWTRTGRGSAWIRLRVPVVDGRPASPLVRVAAAADFGNGISPALDFRRHLYINPDLTVYLYRYPVGEWVGLDAVTWVGPLGAGLAESALSDEAGPIGRSLQSLFLEERPEPLRRSDGG